MTFNTLAAEDIPVRPVLPVTCWPPRTYRYAWYQKSMKKCFVLPRWPKSDPDLLKVHPGLPSNQKRFHGNPCIFTGSRIVHAWRLSPHSLQWYGASQLAWIGQKLSLQCCFLQPIYTSQAYLSTKHAWTSLGSVDLANREIQLAAVGSLCNRVYIFGHIPGMRRIGFRIFANAPDASDGDKVCGRDCVRDLAKKWPTLTQVGK